jgi:hypothetical protein
MPLGRVRAVLLAAGSRTGSRDTPIRQKTPSLAGPGWLRRARRGQA